MFRSLVSLLLVSLLALACSESQPDLSVLRDIGVGCGGFSDFPPVSKVIARDVLTREGDDLFIDEEEYEELVSELASVIRQVTDEYPALADIHAIPDYVSGQVVVGVEGDLRETINAMGIERSERGPVDFITGSSDFDALNVRLGLHAIGPPLLANTSPTFVQLCFSHLLNVPAAADAFLEIDDVLHADPNGYAGDMPDVDAARDGETWYVVFREASGDCPAGCMSEELFRFMVDAGELLEVSEDEAEGNRFFEELTRSVRHRRR